MYKLNPLIIPKFTTHFRRSLSYVPLIKKENEKIIYFYEVEACEFYQQMLPDEFPATKVWGFRGLCMDNVSNMMCYQKSSPGPAFIMKRNVEAKVKWINNITVTCPYGDKFPWCHDFPRI